MATAMSWLMLAMLVMMALEIAVVTTLATVAMLMMRAMATTTPTTMIGDNSCSASNHRRPGYSSAVIVWSLLALGTARRVVSCSRAI